jgi:hypothetical protein
MARGIVARRTAVVAATLCVLVASASAQRPREHEVKAEFIERFTRFIRWPPRAFPSDSAPFVIVVVGGNPFGDYLDRLVAGRQIHGRPVVVRYLDAVEHEAAISGAHIVYVTAGGMDDLRRIIVATSGRPVLTIGDLDGSAARGALMDFYLDGRQVRFGVNLRQVRRSGLEFRSGLLRLARLVATR